MNPYSHADWLKFREVVIALDGNRCIRCLRSRADGVVLQVHHVAYRPGRLPWDYGYDECETLCKGCHAEEHGKVMPRSGWISIGSDDLGEYPADQCELCGTDLRHIYLVEHRSWGTLAVGTDCHDMLTGTTEASEFRAAWVKASRKRKRFVSSPRWQALGPTGVSIDQNGISVLISGSAGGFQISMDGARGKVEHGSLLEAKLRVFELIESGEATAYLARRRRKAEARRRALRFA